MLKLLFILAYAGAVLHAFTNFTLDEAAVRALILAWVYILAYGLIRWLLSASGLTRTRVMHEVIDARTIGIKQKPKFLTGTPGWMEGPVGGVLGLIIFGCLVYRIYEWLPR